MTQTEFDFWQTTTVYVDETRRRKSMIGHFAGPRGGGGYL